MSTMTQHVLLSGQILCETLKNIFQNVVGWRIWNATWVMSFQAMFVLFFCANELFGVTEG